ncbi:HAD-IIB family hydrolase [Danxiaibacter flavus]|uniref:phosphomannomutase n=1 Tax=Danxiaibacter flavus TaxID=3049108 RepID=A0ABV3ZLW4_9BACT|nr:HAD-IIB family hydrolase [Chitinophagaceae bacterium DXS]
MKKLIIFDLDGTLAESKAAIDPEMSDLIGRLLKVAKMAIISGGDWPQFQTQVLSHLSSKQNMQNLSILPTCGTKYYRYRSGWKKIYAEDLTVEERKKITDNIEKTIKGLRLGITKTWGEQIEDRGSQITFSALGQHAPGKVKKKWDPDLAKRKKIKSKLDRPLREFSVEIGGSTSIDITKRGIDKAYGIHKLEKILSIRRSEIIYIGDALFAGGNDYPAISTGVTCIQVKGPEETKKVIETIIACLEKTTKRKQ